MKSILDPTFRYTSSVNTDISKTFARIRREQKAARADREAPKAVLLNEPCTCGHEQMMHNGIHPRLIGKCSVCSCTGFRAQFNVVDTDGTCKVSDLMAQRAKGKA